MSARTPGPRTLERLTSRGSIRLFAHGRVVLVIRAGSEITTPQASELVDTLIHRYESHDTLTAQVAALREALRECVTGDDATCYQTRKERTRLMYVSEVARAALAKGGAE